MSHSPLPQPSPIGVALRALREGAGLSRRALAKVAGVDQSHLSRVESGERSMSPELVTRIVQALAELAGKNEPPP